jgi:hypothetical protein
MMAVKKSSWWGRVPPPQIKLKQRSLERPKKKLLERLGCLMKPTKSLGKDIVASKMT